MGSPAGSFFHKGRVLRRVTHGLALALAVAAGFGAAAGLPPGATPPGEAPFGGRPFQALVDRSKTSIYLGSVSLTLSPFLWHDGTFAAGRAVPLGAGAARGKIKVRVHVGKVELIFNSAFRLAAVE
jgi:hypothetical protein